MTHLRPTKTRDEVITPCRGRHELFDSTSPDAHAYAAAICATCPFILECDMARRDTQASLTAGAGLQGTWAGKRYAPPRKVRRALPPQNLPSVPCGTLTAYRRHLRNGEQTCDACKAANNQRNAKLRGAA